MHSALVGVEKTVGEEKKKTHLYREAQYKKDAREMGWGGRGIWVLVNHFGWGVQISGARGAEQSGLHIPAFTYKSL